METNSKPAMQSGTIYPYRCTILFCDHSATSLCVTCDRALCLHHAAVCEHQANHLVVSLAAHIAPHLTASERYAAQIPALQQALYLPVEDELEYARRVS